MPEATSPLSVWRCCRKPGAIEKSAARQQRIVAHRAADFKDAENWDLDFWQTPEQRLSALVAIRRDVMQVEKARLQNKRLDRY